MWTKAGKVIFTKFFCKSGGYTFPEGTLMMDGVSSPVTSSLEGGAYVPAYRSVVTNTNAYNSGKACVNSLVSLSFSSYAGMVTMFVGSGGTEPTENDYKLETPVLLTCLTAPTLVLGKYDLTYTITLKNETGADTTIREIALAMYAPAATGNSANHSAVMLARRVLSNPVALPNGGAYTFSWKMDFSELPGLTKAGRTILTGCLGIGTGAKALQVKDYLTMSGETVTMNITDVQCVPCKKGIPTYTNFNNYYKDCLNCTQPISSSYDGILLLYVGSGTTPPTDEDTTLESPVVLNMVNVDPIAYSDGVNGLISVTYQNNTGADVDINEIALACLYKTGTYMEPVMLSRKVLASPIKMKAGEVYNFTWIINFNDLTD